MATNDTKNVSVTKGIEGGYFYVAAIGSTLPTDYSTALASAFANVGFIADDGVQHKKSTSTSDFKDGLTLHNVETALSEITRDITVTLIEMSADAIKFVYGDDAVTVASGGDISYKDTDAAMKHVSIVEELILKNGRQYRRVFPNAQIIEWGDHSDVATDLQKRPVTLRLYPDSTGAYEYGYMEAAQDEDD